MDYNLSHESLKNDEREASRSGYLAEKIIFIDGLFGCGKTMLAPIVGALDRVELPTFVYEIEYACALYYLERMTLDAAVTTVRMLTDLKLYDLMMSREVNFRPGDLSSVWRSVTPFRYLRRLLQKGDEAVPARLHNGKPILLIATHNLFGISEPVFAGLKERVVFIEVVRHPLYMIKQQTLNMERLHGDVRDFTIYFQWQGHELPFFARGWEEQYLASNPVERSIYYMEHSYRRIEEIKERRQVQYQAKIITVPFERFVLDPLPDLGIIAEALDSRITAGTRKMMRKQHVPRKKYADGIALRIYKRCGWEPSEQEGSEREELEKRRQFAVERGASLEALAVLDKLALQYEQHYLPDLAS